MIANILGPLPFLKKLLKYFNIITHIKKHFNDLIYSTIMILMVES